MAKELLQGVYLFKNLGPAEIQQLSKICISQQLPPGQTIFQETEEANTLYIVKYGSVKISHTSPTGEVVEVGTLGSGDHFGEMPFIDGKKRTAKAETLENSEILKIEYATLKRLLDQQPLIAARFYRAVSKFLSARLNITTHDLSFARERNLKHHVG